MAASPVQVTVSPSSASVLVGGTVHFTAAVTGSAEAGVTWAVAETEPIAGVVDAGGRYTADWGGAGGTFHVVAASWADPARSGAATVTVVDVPRVPLDGCAAITGSGHYALAADLSSSGACLDVGSAQAITLDCAGHAVTGRPALRLADVNAFAFVNCTFRAADPRYQVVDLLRATRGVFRQDAFEESWVNVLDAADVRFEVNTFRASYQQYASARMVLSGNSMVAPIRDTAPIPALIATATGWDNVLVNNAIDGSWSGSGQLEADDGIVLSDERGDLVAGNAISNVWDCGIEATGAVVGATVRDNTIRHAGYCGIGGWYWLSLSASTVAGNTVEDAPRLLEFYRLYGLRPAWSDGVREQPADDAVRFADNVFEGNRLVPAPTTTAGLSAELRLFQDLAYAGTLSAIPGERVPAPSDFDIGNVTFRENDFGHLLQAPQLGGPAVPGVVVDGGGNVCSPPGPDYPLACR